MAGNQDKYELVSKTLDEKIKELSHSEEDIKLIKKLTDAYFRKKYISNSNPEVISAGILWQYSRMNFLWEGNKKWSRQNFASLFKVGGTTIGSKAAEIEKALKIKIFDERFCRKDVSSGNPLNNLAVLSSGMIVPREMAAEQCLFSAPLRKSKEDYYYDGLECFEEGNISKAMYYFRKALEIDGEYVDAIHGMGLIFFDNNLKRAKEYYQKALELTKKHFNNQWPEKLEWGITENRQYLRTIQSLGLLLWKEGKAEESKELFALNLKLNPDDNQGIRYLIASILKGLNWNEFGEIEDRCIEKGNYKEMENLLKEQNDIHKFWNCAEEDE